MTEYEDDDDRSMWDEPGWYDEPSRTERTLAFVVLFKRLVILLGTLGVVGLGIWLLIGGAVVPGILTLFVGPPIWYVVADIATGLLVLPFVGGAALADRRGR